MNEEDNMTTYVGIDAGVVSGVAVLRYNKDIPELMEVEGTDNLVSYMQAEMFKGTPMVVFYEKFVISARTLKTHIVYDTLLFNGWLHHEGRRYPYIDTEGFTPSQSKSFSTDAKLKHLGWHSPTKGGHQNDAARVLMLGLTKRRDERVMGKLKEML